MAAKDWAEASSPYLGRDLCGRWDSPVSIRVWLRALLVPVCSFSGVSSVVKRLHTASVLLLLQQESRGCCHWNVRSQDKGSKTGCIVSVIRKPVGCRTVVDDIDSHRTDGSGSPIPIQSSDVWPRSLMNLFSYQLASLAILILTTTALCTLMLLSYSYHLSLYCWKSVLLKCQCEQFFPEPTVTTTMEASLNDLECLS